MTAEAGGSDGRPIKVAFCTSELGLGGPERVVLTLLAALDRDRIEPHLVVADSTGSARDLVPDDVPVTVARGPGSRYPVLGLARSISASRADVAIGTHRLAPTLLATKRLLRGDVKLISRPANNMTSSLDDLRDGSPLKYRIADRLDRVLLRDADAVIAQSRQMERDIRARMGRRADRIRIATIPNPVDVEDALARSQASVPTPPPGRPTLVSVGRLSRQKGHDRVIEALAALDTAPDATLWILGDGPQRQHLEALAAGLGVDRRVHFLGQVADPLPIVARADIFVLGSRWEGLPNALIEAQALGVPAVAYGGEAAGDDIVVPDVTGWVVDPAAQDGLPRALQTAVGAAPALDRAAVRAQTDRRFGSRTVAEMYAQLCEDVVAGTTRSA